MNNAGESFRPVLLSGKEYDAVTAALLPLLEEMKRHHAERRRRGDRRTRKTASLLQRGSGAGLLGFLGFLHKFTILFEDHRRARRPRVLSPAFGEIRSRFCKNSKTEPQASINRQPKV